MAGQWSVRFDLGCVASAIGSRRQDRLGSVVHRRHFDSGESRRCWRDQKSTTSHPDEPEDHALGRSKGGFGSKIHILVDGNGTPLEIEVTGGQVHDSQQLEPVLKKVQVKQKRGRPKSRPKRLAGDKGYSSKQIRQYLKDRGIEAIIPHKDNEKARHDPDLKFDKDTYRRRSIVEQTIGWLKECRRIGTRFEKLAINFLAMVKLAMIKRSLKLVF
jgi:transposase